MFTGIRNTLKLPHRTNGQSSDKQSLTFDKPLRKVASVPRVKPVSSLGECAWGYYTHLHGLPAKHHQHTTLLILSLPRFQKEILIPLFLPLPNEDLLYHSAACLTHIPCQREELFQEMEPIFHPKGSPFPLLTLSHLSQSLHACSHMVKTYNFTSRLEVTVISPEGGFSQLSFSYLGQVG